MSKLVLDLTYGTTTIYNLQSTWLQPLTMSPGYMLCYEDDKYERGVVYRSQDKKYLKEVQDKIMTAHSIGKQYVKLY